MPAARDNASSRARALISRVGEVMTLPMIVESLIELTGNPSTTAPQIAEIITKDPVLAAKVLRTANSSFFGFRSRTASVSGAVVRLGMKQVRSVALAMGVSKLFSGQAGREGYSRANLWVHSVAVGTMNELMTAVCPLQEVRQAAGEALLAGLVHDIGVIVEDQYMSKRFPEAPAAAFSLKEHLHQVERQMFGWDHAELGGMLLERWKFPERVAAAVRLHHGGPGLADNVLAVMTAMSEFLVARAAVGYCDCHPERISTGAFGKLQQRLGLMGAALNALRERFSAGIEEALEVFSPEAAGGA